MNHFVCYILVKSGFSSWICVVGTFRLSFDVRLIQHHPFGLAGFAWVWLGNTHILCCDVIQTSKMRPLSPSVATYSCLWRRHSLHSEMTFTAHFPNQRGVRSTTSGSGNLRMSAENRFCSRTHTHTTQKQKQHETTHTHTQERRRLLLQDHTSLRVSCSVRVRVWVRVKVEG